jgi:hypothetical protein
MTLVILDHYDRHCLLVAHFYVPISLDLPAV